jgi:DNA replication protein DnaC
LILKPLAFRSVEHTLCCPTCSRIYSVTLPASLEAFDTDCPECTAAKGSAPRMTAEETEALNWQLALGSIGVPKKFLSITRDTLALGKLAHWNGDPWCLCFAGPNGVGKTWQAIRVLAELRMRTGDSCLFVEAADLIEEIKAAFDSSDCPLDRYSNVRWLCIDDIGQEYEKSEFAKERLAFLFRRRYNEQRGTIFTTNLDVRQNGFTLLGPAVKSRVSECRPIIMGGADRRATR